MKYIVSVPYICWVTVELEADSEDEARMVAIDEAHITRYCGDRGSGKLIGVDGSHLSIETDSSQPCSGAAVEYEVDVIEVEDY